MGSGNAAVELLARNLERHPDKIAYWCGERYLTYRELDGECRRFALNLRERGILPGERVLLVLPDTFAFPIAFLGSLLAGALAVVAGTSLREADLLHILTDSGARLLVTHPSLPVPRAAAEDRVDTLLCREDGLFEPSSAAGAGWTPHLPGGDELAYMLYSSGSTGVPKGIPHRHRDLLLPCTLMGSAILGLTSDDVIFSTSKFTFAYGLVNSLAFPLFFGATAVIHGPAPDPAAVLGIITRHRPTILFSVPTLYSLMLLSCAGDRLDLPLRLCYSAGEALPAAVFEEWLRLTGLEITNGYGSTELSYVCISCRPGAARPGLSGEPVPGYRFRVVDDTGADVPPGSAGHLLVSGDTAAPCYWNLPGKSAETMPADGFVRTGDLFVVQEGSYYYQGRNDDMIKSGGHWVSPIPVEDLLRTHPVVAECAVVAVPVSGLVRPGAFVVLAAGATETPGLVRELRHHVTARLPDYMCPVRFTFVQALPRTTTGKIQRYRLRDTCEALTGC